MYREIFISIETISFRIFELKIFLIVLYIGGGEEGVYICVKFFIKF